MSNSGKLLAFLKNRYQPFLLVTLSFITFSLALSYRRIKKIRKTEKDLRDLIQENLSPEELEFECQKLVQRTVTNQTFTVEELESSGQSLKNLANLCGKLIDYAAYKKILYKEAHLNFKQSFSRTASAASSLEKLLGSSFDPHFKKMFARVLQEGNFESAAAYAKRNFKPVDSKFTKVPETTHEGSANKKPWVVLVTGLNGIRKTSSINSSWFQQILFEALEEQLEHTGLTAKDLPDGSNSYFRQLDFIVSTVANEEFKKLYSIKDVGIYAKLKNAIFCRYRTLSEIIGMLLVGDAVKKRMNVFIETSGRDTSMFDYVDFCFPKQDYNKLVVHFTINEIAYAQTSVDKRMSFEMKKGKEALKEGGVERVLGLIQANSGGPFGSAHLPDIQKASSITHEAIFNKNSSLCSDWYKAHILIEGKDDQPWTAVANVKNCTVFTFLSSIMFKNGRADIRREVKY